MESLLEAGRRSLSHGSENLPTVFLNDDSFTAG
jgi:hypothetical protein